MPEGFNSQGIHAKMTASSPPPLVHTGRNTKPTRTLFLILLTQASEREGIVQKKIMFHLLNEKIKSSYKMTASQSEFL